MNTNVIGKYVASVAVVSILAVSSPAFAATTPMLTVTGSTTPFSVLSISGSGFQSGEIVHIHLGPAIATTTTNASGSFSAVLLTIPNMAAGLYPLIAIGETSGSVGLFNLYIGAFYATVAPSSWWTAPGSIVTFSGTGFAPHEQIAITQSGSSTPFASFTTSADGSFAAQGSFVVPYSLRNGNASLTVQGLSSAFTQVLVIGVGDLYPYALPSSWYILPGNTVTFSGGGFGANEGVSIYQGASSTPIAHASADGNGSFSPTAAVMVPYGPGAVHFRAVGDVSGVVANVPITRANFYPTLTPSVYYSAPSGTLSLTGSGFAPQEAVKVTTGIGTTTVTATADATGNFAIPSFTLPSVGGTLLTLSAVGQLSGATSQVTIAMGQYYTWLLVNTWYALAATPLVVTGHNYAPGEHVTLTALGSAFATATADAAGDFTAHTTVPYAPAGTLSITATGELSKAPAALEMTVAPTYTDLQLAHYAGAPGSVLELLGHGYVPNDVIEVTTDRTGSSPVTTIHADSNGSFDDKSFSIPAGWAEGTLTLTVKGTHSFDTKSIIYYVTGP